jgi:hypothetical protein
MVKHKTRFSNQYGHSIQLSCDRDFPDMRRRGLISLNLADWRRVRNLYICDQNVKLLLHILDSGWLSCYQQRKKVFHSHIPPCQGGLELGTNQHYL